MSRLVFLGSPPAAATSLNALLEAGHDVRLVVSQPDRRRGRGPGLVPSAVKSLALERGLEVSDRVADVVGSGAEIGVVVAFGRIIPSHVLEAVPMLNVHFSLLPRWRGAAPVERAILAGDEETGVSLMRLDEGLDTGPVLATRALEIAPSETSASLTSRLADLGARLLVDTLAGVTQGLGPGEPQVGEATYARKIEPDELRIDWNRDALELERLVRLGRAWTTLRGKRLRVLSARAEPTGATPASPGELHGHLVACGNGWLALEEVRPEGGRSMGTEAWKHGLRLGPVERLGT